MRSAYVHGSEPGLSRLSEGTAKDEPRKPQRIGFMKGQMTFPSDRAAFKAIAADEIALILVDD